jgi:hypothetical protein
MRPLLTILITFASICSGHGQTVKSGQVRFNGLYKTSKEIDKEDNDSTSYFIRFYPDGTVIDVSSGGGVEDLKNWFNLKMDRVSIGKYEIHGKRIRFSTTQNGVGTVIYQGRFHDHYLLIKWKSLINGRKGRERYYFVEVKDLK